MTLDQVSPIIGLPADVKVIGPHNFHCVGEKYVNAVINAMDGLPLMIPSVGDNLKSDAALDLIDGLLLTGGYANIEPERYDGGSAYEGCLLDPARDATTLSLIPQAIEKGVPILGICRGLQELNVALGGSLHQKVQEVEGFNDHREDNDLSLGDQYDVAHEVLPEAGGFLYQITQGKPVMVNSLHGQGIDKLGADLKVECRAPDGLVEGVSLNRENHFVLAVQWHPEWEVTSNPFYLAIFERFKQACVQRRLERIK